MNIYKLSQKEVTGYDTFDSMVVIAENEEKARKIHPEIHHNEKVIIKDNKWQIDDGSGWTFEAGHWVSYENRNKIKIELLGIANIKIERLITASFWAG